MKVRLLSSKATYWVVLFLKEYFSALFTHYYIIQQITMTKITGMVVLFNLILTIFLQALFLPLLDVKIGLERPGNLPGSCGCSLISLGCLPDTLCSGIWLCSSPSRCMAPLPSICHLPSLPPHPYAPGHYLLLSLSAMQPSQTVPCSALHRAFPARAISGRSILTHLHTHSIRGLHDPGLLERK